jgi:hypothetical protein
LTEKTLIFSKQDELISKKGQEGQGEGLRDIKNKKK